jgi:hypothetical protein
MTLYDQIIEAYPELSDIKLFDQNVMLQNDSDGHGDFIAKWDYSKALPKGLKLGK